MDSVHHVSLLCGSTWPTPQLFVIKPLTVDCGIFTSSKNSPNYHDNDVSDVSDDSDECMQTSQPQLYLVKQMLVKIKV